VKGSTFVVEQFYNKVIRIIVQVFESVRFAFNALKGNLLRTILSLLGVTVGIFAIITVFTIVDSLERSIRNSMNFLGDRVINIEKWPWLFENNYPWWKFINRPQASFPEYRFLEENLRNYDAITIYAIKQNGQLNRSNNSTNGITLIGVGGGYNEVYDTPIELGRYFSTQEIDAARNIAVIGFDIAEALFGALDPIGKDIMIRGMKYRIIGVLEKQGANIIDAPSKDKMCLIPYFNFAKLYSMNNTWGVGSTIAVKGKIEDEGLIELENEITGLMRAKRGLRPIQDDNFALNRPEIFANMISNLFAVIGLAGWVIGGFSILVGGFGIANIMFVSVKERTNIIGIQKSLGAKNYFILSQFLFEAIFLSLIGGAFGIMLVYLITFIPMGSLEILLTFRNIFIGLGVSIVIGVASGIIPAALAARLDPVIAIRTQ
jgi:putative ABC transport system permease protein